MYLLVHLFTFGFFGSLLWCIGFSLVVLQRFSCTEAYGILVSQPGIESAAPGTGTRILNHWTTREVLVSIYYSINNTNSLAETSSIKKKKCTALKSMKITKAVIFTGLLHIYHSCITAPHQSRK